MNTADLSQIFLLQHTRTQGRDGPEEQRTLASRYGCAEGCPPLPAETAPALSCPVLETGSAAQLEFGANSSECVPGAGAPTALPGFLESDLSPESLHSFCMLFLQACLTNHTCCSVNSRLTPSYTVFIFDFKDASLSTTAVKTWAVALAMSPALPLLPQLSAGVDETLIQFSILQKPETWLCRFNSERDFLLSLSPVSFTSVNTWQMLTFLWTRVF